MEIGYIANYHDTYIMPVKLTVVSKCDRKSLNASVSNYCIVPWKLTPLHDTQSSSVRQCTPIRSCNVIILGINCSVSLVQ